MAGETYDEVRQLAADGVSFAPASAAEDRGEVFDEERFGSVTVEHHVPTSAWPLGLVFVESNAELIQDQRPLACESPQAKAQKG